MRYDFAAPFRWRNSIPYNKLYQCLDKAVYNVSDRLARWFWWGYGVPTQYRIHSSEGTLESVNQTENKIRMEHTFVGL